MEEYIGHSCTLHNPWRGYSYGEIVDYDGTRLTIHLSSGAEIEVYPDEIDIHS